MHSACGHTVALTHLLATCLSSPVIFMVYICFDQAWRDRAAYQMSLKREAAMKLQRLTVGQLYGDWAAAPTGLHLNSPDTACKAATLAAWSHIIRVCLTASTGQSLLILHLCKATGQGACQYGQGPLGRHDIVCEGRYFLISVLLFAHSRQSFCMLHLL